MAIGRDIAGFHHPGFLESLQKAKIAFPKVLLNYGRVFLVGVLVGVCFTYKAPTETERQYERIREATDEIRASRAAGLERQNDGRVSRTTDKRDG